MRDLRRVRGLTLQDVAGQMGVTYQQVQKYESGTDRLSASGLFQLCHFFNIPADKFFEPSLADEVREHAVAREIEDPEEGLAFAENFIRIRGQGIRRALKDLTTRLSTYC